MRKQLKKWGDSVIIVISPEDLKNYNLKVGDIIDISDLVKIKKRKNGI